MTLIDVGDEVAVFASAGAPAPVDAAGAASGTALRTLLSGLAAAGYDWTPATLTIERPMRGTPPGPVRHELLVTAIRPAKSGSTVSARWRVLTESGDAPLLSGSLGFASSDSHEAETQARFRFCSAEWGRLVAPLLEANEAFTSATSAYDGTIGLASGVSSGGPVDEVHFRIYRGRVVGVSRRSVLGADFVLRADELTWLELILGERNDFMDRAMQGAFSASGSGYEYLRLTKVLVQIIDAARAVAREDGR
jgi:hypothetical protein